MRFFRVCIPKNGLKCQMRCAMMIHRFQRLRRVRITQHLQRERNDYMAAAFMSEFLVEFVKLVVLAAVAVAAIFCGKKLRDRKDAKKASEENHNR